MATGYFVTEGIPVLNQAGSDLVSTGMPIITNLLSSGLTMFEKFLPTILVISGIGIIVFMLVGIPVKFFRRNSAGLGATPTVVPEHKKRGREFWIDGKLAGSSTFGSHKIAGSNGDLLKHKQRK